MDPTQVETREVMDNEATSGIERAVFGAVARDDIDAWLNRHLQARPMA